MSDHPFETRSGKGVVAVGVCTLGVAACVALGIAVSSNVHSSFYTQPAVSGGGVTAMLLAPVEAAAASFTVMKGPADQLVENYDAVADPITVQTCGSEFNFAMNVSWQVICEGRQLWIWPNWPQCASLLAWKKPQAI